MDDELIALYVSEYIDEIAACIPDLVGSMDPGPADVDAITDFAADYIHDREHPKEHIPEIRAAAFSIAKSYC